GNERGNGTTSYCVTTGNISGNSSVGGICGNVGHSYGALKYYTRITQCKSTGNITATTSNAGGIFGAGRTYLSHSYSTSSVSCPTSCGGVGGTLTQGSITKCYSTGLITGTTNAKGFLGVNSGGSSSGCYWDIETSGKTTSAVGTGKTTTEMKTQSTFTDWDFETIWNIGTHFDGYPFLRAFPVLIITIINSIDSLIEFGCGE
ncbi:11057_t:CDS:1, partial [Racocetra persica]